jgi:hypothetical protein
VLKLIGMVVLQIVYQHGLQSNKKGDLMSDYYTIDNESVVIP